MEELIDVFSNNQVLILGIVIFIFGLILLGYLLTLILTPKKSEKKEEKIEEEKINKLEEPKEIMTIETSDPLNNQEKVDDQLEQVLNKMQKTLDEKEELDNIESFEREQEESAIISYQELLKAAKKDFPQMNLDGQKMTTVSTEKEEPVIPISTPKEGPIKEAIIAKEEPIKETTIEKQEISTSSLTEEIIPKTIEEKEDKKFKSSTFISPIGVSNGDNPNYYKEVKVRRDYLKEMSDSRFNTVDIQTEELDYEKQRNEQFLEDLKNFRNNL